MHRHAVDFYSCLYKAEHCNSYCTAQLLHELPQIASRTALDMQITFQEPTIAVGQLKSGHSPGIEVLTPGFYKHFWKYIDMYLYEVFCERYKDGVLPVTCQHTVLSLLPKKIDLTLLKN